MRIESELIVECNCKVKVKNGAGGRIESENYKFRGEKQQGKLKMKFFGIKSLFKVKVIQEHPFLI